MTCHWKHQQTRRTNETRNRATLPQKKKTLEHEETPGLEPVGPRHPEDTVHGTQEPGEAADVDMTSAKADSREYEMTSRKWVSVQISIKKNHWIFNV